jgi:Putative protein-S-isoprenylcysteine methyltransferase
METAGARTSKAFLFSLIAAVLILINAVALGIVAKWFIGIMPTLPGSSGNDPMLLYSLSAAGAVLGAFVLFGALMLRKSPLNRKVWGTLIVVFSAPSVIMGGGFIVGFILGIVGGVSAFLGRTVLRFPKMGDKAAGMTLEGAGPKIMAPLFVTFVATALISYAFQPLFNYPLAAAATTILALPLLSVGILFWLLSVGMFLAAWKKEQLETRGPFAVMPIPGVSLMLNWWPILLTSVVMFIAQRMFIHEEEKVLYKKFGEQYREYRKKVWIRFL